VALPRRKKISKFSALDTTLKKAKQASEPFQSEKVAVGYFGIPLGRTGLLFSETRAREGMYRYHMLHRTLCPLGGGGEMIIKEEKKKTRKEQAMAAISKL